MRVSTYRQQQRERQFGVPFVVCLSEIIVLSTNITFFGLQILLFSCGGLQIRRNRERHGENQPGMAGRQPGHVQCPAASRRSQPRCRLRPQQHGRQPRPARRWLQPRRQRQCHRRGLRGGEVIAII